LRGLVADRDIKPKELITYFHTSGVFPTEQEANAGDFYVVKASQSKYIRLTPIDGRRNVKQAYDNKVGNLANHAYGKGANAAISIYIRGSDIKLSLKAKKTIKRGESIFWNYGNREWTDVFMGRIRKHKRKYPNLKCG
jgi:hypothetical protein